MTITTDHFVRAELEFRLSVYAHMYKDIYAYFDVTVAIELV